MTSDLQWRVNIEVTPANASAFHLNDRIAARLPRAVWVGGVLSFRQPRRLHLITGKDERLGGLPLAAIFSTSPSVSDGVAGGSKQWFYREVLLWRHETMIRLLMFKPSARKLFTAIGFCE
jgi:hypothetical protein